MNPVPYRAFGLIFTFTIQFQTLFSTFYGFFSTFLHSTMRYRTRVVFRFRSYCLPDSDWISNQSYSPWAPSVTISTTGLSPSRASFSKELRLWHVDVEPRPHLFYIAAKDSDWPVPLSFDSTNGIASAFFSCGYYNDLLPRVPFPFGINLRYRSLIQGPPVERLHAPPRRLWQLAAPFFSSRAKSSAAWLVTHLEFIV